MSLARPAGPVFRFLSTIRFRQGNTYTDSLFHFLLNAIYTSTIIRIRTDVNYSLTGDALEIKTTLKLPTNATGRAEETHPAPVRIHSPFDVKDGYE